MRHRHRRFGPGPYLTGLRRTGRWGVDFPFDVPAVAAIEALDLSAPVTLLAGDNGTGKSTIAEAVAEAMGFAAEGGELAIVVRAPRRVRSSSSPPTRRSCSRSPARGSRDLGQHGRAARGHRCRPARR